MEDLGQYRHGRIQRLLDPLQGLPAMGMQPVLGIEQGHQRSGVNQDQRLIFRPIACRTPRRVSLAGAIAYPPGPRSSS